MQQSDNQTIVSAFNLIAIKCSNSSINCLLSNCDEVKCNISDIKTIVSVHLTVLRSSAACLTSHLIVSASDNISIRCSIFDIKSTICLFIVQQQHYIYSNDFFTSLKIVDQFYTYSFDQVFSKKISIISISIRSFSYRNTCKSKRLYQSLSK